jgi:hypothetical protein
VFNLTLNVLIFRCIRPKENIRLLPGCRFLRLLLENIRLLPGCRLLFDRFENIRLLPACLPGVQHHHRKDSQKVILPSHPVCFFVGRPNLPTPPMQLAMAIKPRMIVFDPEILPWIPLPHHRSHPIILPPSSAIRSFPRYRYFRRVQC